MGAFIFFIYDHVYEWIYLEVLLRDFGAILKQLALVDEADLSFVLY